MPTASARRKQPTPTDQSPVGFNFDDAPLQSTRWFKVYHCVTHKRTGDPCMAQLLDPNGKPTGQLCGGKYLFDVLIKRVREDNFNALRIARQLDTDPTGWEKLTKLIGEDVLMDWQHVQRDGKPLEPTQSVKEELLTKWESFRLWVWLTARDEGGFWGNGAGGSDSPAGGAPSAASISSESTS